MIGWTMTGRRLDIPLEESAVGRSMMWIIAGLVYLAILAVAVAALAERTAERYRLQPRIVTVALPPAETFAAEDDVDTALEVLLASKGVVSAAVVPREELAKLVEPWLGDDGSDDDMPLPRLIDVTFKPDVLPDLKELTRLLRSRLAGVAIDAELVPFENDKQLASFLRDLFAASALVILAVLALVAVMITRANLRSHAGTVELLRVMGALNGYIARQIERHALMQGVRGGLLGGSVALATFLLVLAVDRLTANFPFSLDLRPIDWFLFAAIPIIGAGLVTVVAWLTAVWHLSRNP